MRVSATKTSQRVERNIYLTSKRIKGYGLNNDYPQKVLEILNSSGTGKSCYDIHVRFTSGGGFIDPALNDYVVNEKGERASTLLRKLSKDLKAFNGFAVLVKYDFLGNPVEYYNVPFEHCRLEIAPNKTYTGCIAVYPDWTGVTGQAFRQQDVKFINRFDPEMVLSQIVDAGGPAAYLGQIYYYTSDGDLEYPTAPFDPVITDMLTEEAVSTVKHRNTKYNFLPAGILVRKGKKSVLLDNGQLDMNDAYNKAQEESRNWLVKAQGDENASKMWIVDVDADEEKPEFIPFEAKNLDKQYENTEPTVKENIAGMFMVPPVLRGIDVGAGFGSELVEQAYNFMNSITGDDRNAISTVFMDLLPQFADFTIKPLKYIDESTGSQS